MSDSFSSYHPAVNFSYYAVIIVLTVALMHPALLGISLIAAGSYSIFISGKGAVKRTVLMPLIVVAIAAIINMLTVHRGANVLFYWSDNPYTKEALVFGVISGAMISAILLWFSTYNEVMTGDKTMRLFGKTLPGLSIVFTLVLQFIPRFRKQSEKISDAQKCLGDGATGSRSEKLKSGSKRMSILTTWSFENAMDTADSMKARGYASGKRSSYYPYPIVARDIRLLIYMGAAFAITIVAAAKGRFHFACYPTFEISKMDGLGILGIIAFALLVFTPMIVSGKEALKWKALK